jgi:hypothetical protein
MAITVRHGHFGRNVTTDWRIWLGAMLGGVLLVAGGFYFLRDGEGGGSTNVTPASASSPAIIGPAPFTGADMPRTTAPATAPAPSSPTGFQSGGTDSSNVVYIVRDEAQLAQMQLAIHDADSIRAAEGLPPSGGEFVIVGEESTGSFLAGMDEANGMRVSLGLAPYRLIDLR